MVKFTKEHKHTNKEKQKIVLTNALIYANGPAHIGHMVEYIQTDIISRALKSLGHEVIFCGAEDTHGAPIEIKAFQLKLTPEQLIKKYETEHLKNFIDYFIKYDSYYNTNSEENKKLAELIFKRLKEKDHIYKKPMELTFCPNCKRFLPDRYVKGKCPKCGAEDQYGDQCEKCATAYKTTELINPYCSICKTKPERKISEHYFFKLSEFPEKLRTWLNDNKHLQPEIRNQILGWIDKGLDDWCVSRDGPYFGFKIPEEENKYFYVWLDAPIGYISSLSHYFNNDIHKALDCWNDARVLHVIGKDIVYFHLLFWPAVLMGANIKLPENVIVHGFINVNNEKMSKSRGTFLTAEEFSKIAKPEYLRFYYASNLSRTMTDINLDFEDFKERINSELVSNIANFIYRTLSFTNVNFNSKITELTDPEFKIVLTELAKESKEVFDLFEQYELREALKKISHISAQGNKFFQSYEPWKLIKSEKEEDKEAAQQVLNVCVNIVKELVVLLKPVVPDFAEKIEKQLNLKDLDYISLGNLIENHKINKAEIIFQKIEKIELSDAQKEKTETKQTDAEKQTKKHFEKKESNNSKQENTKQANTNQEISSSFENLQLRVAKITKIERHPQAEKLYIEQIDLGDEQRQIVSGLVPYYKEEELLGKKIVVVTNLQPAKLRGVESNGMLLAAQEGNVVGLLLAESSELGDYVFIDEKISENKLNTIASLPQIKIDEFAKVKIHVKDGKVFCDGKELRTKHQKLTVEKVSNGDVK